MKISENSVVYLDANFLVAYFVSAKRKEDKIYNKKAQKIFAYLMVKKCDICLSPLVFDEFWNGVKKEADVKRIRNRLRYWVNKFVQKFGIRGLKDSGVEYYAHYEIYSQLEKYTEKLLSLPQVKLIQFVRIIDGIQQALKNIKQYQMKPRDAFHLSLMQDLKIPFVVSFDPKFIRIPAESGVRCINEI